MNEEPSSRRIPGDIGVGLIFLGAVGVITIVMLAMVILFSLKILV